MTFITDTFQTQAVPVHRVDEYFVSLGYTGDEEKPRTWIVKAVLTDGSLMDLTPELSRPDACRILCQFADGERTRYS